MTTNGINNPLHMATTQENTSNTDEIKQEPSWTCGYCKCGGDLVQARCNSLFGFESHL